jgi:hypothetical protein
MFFGMKVPYAEQRVQRTVVTADIETMPGDDRRS